MSFTFNQLKNKTDKELIEKHDENSGVLNGNSNKETPEMLRNELFRRELSKINKEVKSGNEIMVRLTWVITGLTFLIFLLTCFLVYIELW